MRFIIEASCPHQPFNTLVGGRGGAIKPEVCYFTDSGVDRADASGAPPVAESQMLAFKAMVHDRVERCTSRSWRGGAGG